MSHAAQEKRESEIHDATSTAVSNPFSLSSSPVCSAKIASRLKHFLRQCAKLTSDQSILDCAAHYHIDFIRTAYSLENTDPNQITFPETEQRIINSEILKLYEKGVIEPCMPETEEFISTVLWHPHDSQLEKLVIDIQLPWLCFLVLAMSRHFCFQYHLGSLQKSSRIYCIVLYCIYCCTHFGMLPSFVLGCNLIVSGHVSFDTDNACLKI